MSVPAEALAQASQAGPAQKGSAEAAQRVETAPPRVPSGARASEGLLDLGESFPQHGESFPQHTEDELSRIPAPLNADPVAARLAEAYRRTGRAKTVRKSSYVMYPFGKTEPVVTCAPLRACTIELQKGERVISVIAGDTQRWLISQTATGTAGRTPLIAVKPTGWNITTNMVLSTNRRIYDVTLDAPPKEEAGPEANPTSYYTARVKFYYPEDFVRQAQRRQQIAQRARQDQRRRVSRTVPVRGAEGTSLTDLNFNYHWTAKDDYPWEPQEVFDDGRHTYIKLPGKAKGGEIPLLFDATRSGNLELVNYTIRNNTFVADRVMNKAVLVVGIDERKTFLGLPLGKKVRKKARLVIHNGEPVFARTPPGQGGDEGPDL